MAQEVYICALIDRIRRGRRFLDLPFDAYITPSSPKYIGDGKRLAIRSVTPDIDLNTGDPLKGFAIVAVSVGQHNPFDSDTRIIGIPTAGMRDTIDTVPDLKMATWKTRLTSVGVDVPALLTLSDNPPPAPPIQEENLDPDNPLPFIPAASQSPTMERVMDEIGQQLQARFRVRRLRAPDIAD